MKYDESKVIRKLNGQFGKGTVPYDQTGNKHTPETIEKLKARRVGKQPRKPIPMIGKKFNRWTVLSQSGKSGKQYAYLCKCDCGAKGVVSGYNLRAGVSKSCGCWASERMAGWNKQHSGINSYLFGKPGRYAGEKRPEHSAAMRGENNPKWKGGITPANKKFRASEEYVNWRKSVFERDQFTCQFCGQVGGSLHVDHIKPFALFPDLRTDLSNGRTLCVDCHRQTDTWGGGYIHARAN